MPTAVWNVVSEVREAVAAVAEETLDVAKVVNAVETPDCDAMVSVVPLVSAMKLRAVDAFDRRLTPL